MGRFGAERRGAPVAVYLRLSDEPILVKSFPKDWECIIVADPKIEKMLDVTEGFRAGGVAIMNTKKKAGEIQLNTESSKIGVVDATGISLSIFGPRAIHITSTAMISAFAKTTGLVSLGSLVKSVEEKWNGRIAELNVEVMKQAYDQTEVLNLRGGLE